MAETRKSATAYSPTGAELDDRRGRPAAAKYRVLRRAGRLSEAAHAQPGGIMFESAKLDHKVDKETYESEAAQLREDLLNAQFDLIKSKAFQVIILIAGANGTDKAEAVNSLNASLDTHHMTTYALGAPTEEDRQRPRMWRYWRILPPKGTIGIFFGSWYSHPLRDRILKRTKNAELHETLDEINRFEKMLADEGALILKFWFHLGKKEHKTRRKKLKDDRTRHWRMADKIMDSAKDYDEALSVAEILVHRSNTYYAPWTVIGGTDKRYRDLVIGRALLNTMRKRLDESLIRQSVPSSPIDIPPLDSMNVLDSLDLGKQLEKDEYKRLLKNYQDRLHALSQRGKFDKIALVAVFEGNDAAGKGGTIRRVTEALDATICRVYPVAAPTDEELAQPYLWRFWRKIPRLGHLAFFDRSWYGRVL
ncbi:MAG: hypothetical protein ABFS02_14025, partial [Pseudomonadota bacterium]